MLWRFRDACCGGAKRKPRYAVQRAGLGFAMAAPRQKGRAQHVFTIGKDGSVYGPDATVSAGNINDDSIRDVIANALIQEYAKRQDARGG